MYLNCHSYYSLRYGTMSVEELVQKAKTAGAETIALTDINVSEEHVIIHVVRFWRIAEYYHNQLLIEIYICHDKRVLRYHGFLNPIAA